MIQGQNRMHDEWVYGSAVVRRGGTGLAGLIEAAERLLEWHYLCKRESAGSPISDAMAKEFEEAIRRAKS